VGKQLQIHLELSNHIILLAGAKLLTTYRDALASSPPELYQQK